MARSLAKYIVCGSAELREAVCFHYIASHNISIKQVLCNNEQKSLLNGLSKDAVLLIDKITPMTREHKDNLITCLEDSSVYQASLSQLSSSTTTEMDYDKHLLSEYCYEGQISLFSDERKENEDSKELIVTYAIKNTGEINEICAAIHYPEITKHHLTHLLGGIRFSDNPTISTAFRGFSGTAWTVQNIIKDCIGTESKSNTPNNNSIHSISEHLPENIEPDKSVQDTEVLAGDSVEDDNDVVKIISDLSDSRLTRKSVIEVVNLTKGQKSDDIWKILRQKRLTASNFGTVIDAINRNRFPPSLFKTLQGEYDLSGVAAIKWGLEHEDTAKEDYEKNTGNKVESTGLWLHSSGILGASPDGLLDDGEGLVEFKCPYSLRKLSIEEGMEDNKKFYLKKDKDGHIYLDETHSYYHQIQGMLYLVDRSYCDFAVWSPIGGCLITRVIKDIEWEVNLSKLINFYFKQFLPKIVESEDEQCLYKGYFEVLRKVKDVLDDSKQKRVERKISLKQKRTDLKDGKELATNTLQSDLTCSSKQDLFRISFEDSVRISSITAPLSNQVYPPQWHILREHRLTSSFFGKVLAAINRDSFPPSLFKQIMGEYYMNNTTYALWATENEQNAITRYQQETSSNVLPSGIWLDNSGVLGASINGLLADREGIVEIRCLYKFRDYKIDEVLDINSKDFFLERTNDGLRLKKSHVLYDRVQGALYLSQRQYCDVVVMTMQSFEVVRQFRDIEWESNLDVLRSFYFQRLFPHLCGKWGENNVVKDLQRFSLES